MSFENFTIKAQEAVQQALNIAAGKSHQTIEESHLLKGLMTRVIRDRYAGSCRDTTDGQGIFQGLYEDEEVQTVPWHGVSANRA